MWLIFKVTFFDKINVLLFLAKNVTSGTQKSLFEEKNEDCLCYDESVTGKMGTFLAYSDL